MIQDLLVHGAYRVFQRRPRQTSSTKDLSLAVTGSLLAPVPVVRASGSQPAVGTNPVFDTSVEAILDALLAPYDGCAEFAI